MVFIHGKHRDGAEILCQKGPAWSPVFFCPRQAFVVFDMQEICWYNVAGRCRTPVAAHNFCTGSVESCYWTALAAHVFIIKSAAE